MIPTLVYLALFLAIVSICLLLRGESISSMFHTFVGIGIASMAVFCLIIACFVS